MCPAQDVKPAVPGSGSGEPSPVSALSRSLLTVSSERNLSSEQMDRLSAMLQPMAAQLGMTALVLDGGLQAHVHRDLTPLVDAIQAQTAAITKLVDQNTALLSALAEQAPEEDEAPTRYLSGKRIG
jgi:hypothetical protein